MKMKPIFAAAAMCGAIVAFANPETAKPKVDMSPEAQYKRTGGQLIKKGTFTGKVAFIDTQDAVPFEVAQKAAKLLAEQELAELGETSGKFYHEGHHYTLDVTPVFDIVGKPQKYTGEDGVQYRKHFKEQAELKKASSKLTRKMKDIMDDFPDNHPNIEPDEIKQTLKCID